MRNDMGLTVSEKTKAQRYRAQGVDSATIARVLGCTERLIGVYFSTLDQQAHAPKRRTKKGDGNG